MRLQLRTQTQIVEQFSTWASATFFIEYARDCKDNLMDFRILESLYYLPALFLSYWILLMLIRIPIVNTIFSVTTLTHYFKRYHEPETRVRDLVEMKRPYDKANSADAKRRVAD